MNRRGTALILALLLLMLTGALATAALSLAQLRWRSGLARRAAARATLELHSALDRQLAGWQPRFDSLSAGEVIEIGRAEGDRLWRRDSLRRLGPTLYQLRSVVETDGADGAPQGRAAAAVLVGIPRLSADSHYAGSMVLDSTIRRPGPIPGGWWRTD